MGSILLFIGLTIAALTLTLVYGQDNQVPMPKIDLDEWWGAGNKTSVQDTSITEYKICFEDSMIDDLKYRLRNHRQFTPRLRDITYENEYGFNGNMLSQWVNYLAEKYPFKKREQFLNKFPHYTTVIQGLKIHFMRIRSKNTKNRKVLPILLLHGWGGSIREFYEAIPYLLSFGEAKGFALDIIAPSLPGFGFSEAAVRTGMGVDKMAVIFRNLMHRVGYKHYYIQGGDWGSIVASNMATFFPNEVRGYHTTLPLYFTLDLLAQIALGSLDPDRVVKPELKNRLYPLSALISGTIELSGYYHIQATRPDSVGAGLGDSPSGLLAYLLEKLSGGLQTRSYKTNPDGDLLKHLTADQILDNIMLYWVPNSMTTAMRIYAESFNRRYFGMMIESIVSPVPVWVIQAPDEIVYIPPWLIKKKFPNLLHETLPSDGGHFFAWERPREYAQDVVRAVDAFEKWHAWNSSTYAVCSNTMEY